MTRKSRDEIERAIDELSEERDIDNSDLVIVWEDRETGEWFADPDDEEPIDPAIAEAADPLIIMRETIVETDWTLEENDE